MIDQEMKFEPLLILGLMKMMNGSDLALEAHNIQNLNKRTAFTTYEIYYCIQYSCIFHRFIKSFINQDLTSDTIIMFGLLKRINILNYENWDPQRYRNTDLTIQSFS